MAYDDYSTEWHLTESGWVEGAKDFESDPLRLPPSDRLLTFTRSVTQSSPYSGEDVSWTETWRAPELTDQRRTQLLALYGDHPGGEPKPAPRRRPKPKRDW
jgi:hypothetical protein